MHLLLLLSFLMPLVSSAEDKYWYQKKIDFILDSISSLKYLNSRPVCHSPEQPQSLSEKSKWSDAGFKNTDIISISTPPIREPSKKITHEFNPSLVMFRNTGWSLDLIQKHLQKVNEIYSQCGIRVGTSKFIMVDPPNNWLDVGPEINLSLVTMTPVINKPIVYFVRSSLEGHAAYAFTGTGNTCNEIVCGTAWITDDINSPQRIGMYKANYSTVAHELAHILGDSDHVKDGSTNILADSFDKLDGTINPQQCEKFKNSNLVRKL